MDWPFTIHNSKKVHVTGAKRGKSRANKDNPRHRKRRRMVHLPIILSVPIDLLSVLGLQDVEVKRTAAMFSVRRRFWFCFFCIGWENGPIFVKQSECAVIEQFRYIKILAWLQGFLLFYSPKPPSQVRNWPIRKRKQTRYYFKHFIENRSVSQCMTFQYSVPKHCNIASLKQRSH